MDEKEKGSAGVYLDSESIHQSQRSMGSMPLRVSGGGDMTLYWARVIEGASENLLTTSTKHTVFEIEYALRHPLTIRIGERRIMIPEGSFLIVPPGESHQIVESASDGVKFILGFLPGRAGDSLRTSENVRETPVVRGLTEMLLQAPEARRELLHALLQSLLLAFLDAMPADAAQPQRYDDREQCVKRFAALVESANGVGVSVREAAKLVSLSERQLFRYCLDVTGCTPSGMIRQARVRYIRTCLCETRLSLSEIAELSGFQSEYAMAKFFRRSAGMLPSAYRRKMAGKPADIRSSD